MLVPWNLVVLLSFTVFQYIIPYCKNIKLDVMKNNLMHLQHCYLLLLYSGIFKINTPNISFNCKVKAGISEQLNKR